MMVHKSKSSKLPTVQEFTHLMTIDASDTSGVSKQQLENTLVALSSADCTAFENYKQQDVEISKWAVQVLCVLLKETVELNQGNIPHILGGNKKEFETKPQENRATKTEFETKPQENGPDLGDETTWKRMSREPEHLEPFEMPTTKLRLKVNTCKFTASKDSSILPKHQKSEEFGPTTNSFETPKNKYKHRPFKRRRTLVRSHTCERKIRALSLGSFKLPTISLTIPKSCKSSSPSSNSAKTTSMKERSRSLPELETMKQVSHFPIHT